jgi:hypothetical protein
LGHLIVVSPNHVSIHVHNRKIEEHIDGSRLSRLKHDLPIEMQSVGISQFNVIARKPSIGLEGPPSKWPNCLQPNVWPELGP